MLLDDQLISMTEGLEQADRRRRARHPPDHGRVRGQRSRPVRPARGLGRRLRGATVSALDPRVERSDPTLPAIVVVVAGTVALLARPFVVAGPNARIGLLATAYVAIALACIAVPVERGRALIPFSAVALIGLGAVAAAVVLAGPAVPVPWGSAALPLSVLAAVAEEALFRRVAYARFERFGPAPAIVVTRLSVRARPRARVRPRRAARGPRRGPALRVAALGERDLDRARHDPRGGERVGGARMRRALSAALVGALVVLSACTGAPQEEPIRIGAVYPLSGTQGPGGVDEFHGVQVAVQLANADGGVRGRPIELVPVDVPAADAAPGAIEHLEDLGVRLLLGSYGSTISAPAAEAAARRGLLFWETGAVGEMTRCRRGRARVPRRAVGRGPRSQRDRVRCGRVRPGARNRSRGVAVRGHPRRRRLRTRGRRGWHRRDPGSRIHARGHIRVRPADRGHAGVRAGPRIQPAGRRVRVRVPAGRDRHASRDGSAGSGRPGRHRDLVELLHAGVRRRARATRRSACSPRTSRTRTR